MTLVCITWRGCRRTGGYTPGDRLTGLWVTYLVLEHGINTQVRQMASIFSKPRAPFSLFWTLHLCLVSPSCLWCFVLANSAVLESVSWCSRRTESVTGFVFPRADVEARQEDGVVVVPAFPASQGGLPVAEAVQCVVSMMVDHQPILGTKCDRKSDTEIWFTASSHKYLFITQKSTKDSAQCSGLSRGLHVGPD